jgi:hypothetical protein
VKRLYAVLLIGAGLILFRDAAEIAAGGDSPRTVQSAEARHIATSVARP